MLNPVFILGCGRSGTTALGRVLSMHPDIKYLNEPRDLWMAAYPQTDIWSNLASVRGGKLVLCKEDVNENSSNILISQFSKTLSESGRSVLVEKLPINNFRCGLIHEIFPAARFIYIWRNGCEVAKSIESLCLKGRWFAKNGYKWDLLASHAALDPETAHLPSQCDSYYLKGLLEWRLSVTAAEDFLSTLSNHEYRSLSYAEFVKASVESISELFDFIGVGSSSETLDFAKRDIRPSINTVNRELTDQELLIGGKRLVESMSGMRTARVEVSI